MKIAYSGRTPGIGSGYPFVNPFNFEVVSGVAYPDHLQMAILADMRGSGNLDYVTNDVAGNWVINGGLPILPQDVNVDGEIPKTSGLGWGWSPQFFFHDVTGDGRADLIYVLDTPDFGNHSLNIDVWVNLGRSPDGVHFRKKNFAFIHQQGEVSVYPKVYFGDWNGSGVDDLLLCGDNDCLALDFQFGAKPGLLKRVNYSSGATTDYEYTSLATLESTARSHNYEPWPASAEPESGPWKWHSAVPANVVTKVTTNSNVAPPYGLTSVVDYSYRAPVYDRWRGRLRGFKRIRAFEHHDFPDKITDTQFLFGGCLVDDGVEHVLANGFCLNPEQDQWDAVNGLPKFIEVKGTAGVSASTIAYSYAIADTDGGPQGPAVITYPRRIDTYLYDTAAFTPSPSNPAVTPVTSQDQWSSGTETIPVRAAYAHLRWEQQQDSFGNALEIWDRGQIADDDSQIDRPIHTSLNVQPLDTLVPASAAALGRAYRIFHSTVRFDPGGVDPLAYDGALREQNRDFDELGRLKRLRATLHGSVVPLGRSHELGLGHAPDPPQASIEASEIVLTDVTYDDFGNVIQTKGPTNECQTVVYDGPYFDSSGTTHTFTAGCGAGTDLASYQTFDRGLGVMIGASAPSGAGSLFAHDAFGRLQTVYGPNPATGFPDVLELSVTYSDPAMPGPLHWVKSVRGSDPNTAMTTWSYSDSLGQPVITFTSADIVADPTDWIARPAPTRDPSGAPETFFYPAFYAGDPAAYTVGAPGGGVAGTALYEFTGRRIETHRSDNELVERVDYHALSTDHYTAENIGAFASHPGMFTKVTMDGHGRLKQTEKLTEQGTLATMMYYTPTGETSSIWRYDPVSHNWFSRWRMFDSLGRVVRNSEPNTSTLYHANMADGLSDNMWRYAYDNSGRLVGTRDARGCGKNLFYDGAGRLTAEDYSPHRC
jgi:YD repeat-containing protein